MIEPTIGRVVLYHPSKYDLAQMNQISKAQPFDAHIVYVWGNRLVNLVVFDHDGIGHARTSVNLLQDGDPPNEDGRYCEWMPYQKGQAAKAEAAVDGASQQGPAQGGTGRL